MPITTPTELLHRYSSGPTHFRKVAERLLKPAAEMAGFTFQFPEAQVPGIIQAEIIRNLEESDLVLCDISTLNANVFFELGIRVTLDLPMALVRDEHTKLIPFDNSMLNCYTYQSDLSDTEKQVPELVKLLIAAGRQKRNPVWKYFGITQRAARFNPSSSTDAKIDRMLKTLDAISEELLGPRPVVPEDIAVDAIVAGAASKHFDRPTTQWFVKLLKGTAPLLLDAGLDTPRHSAFVMTLRPMNKADMGAVVDLAKQAVPSLRGIKLIGHDAASEGKDPQTAVGEYISYEGESAQE